MIPLVINKDVDNCGKVILSNTNLVNKIVIKITKYNNSTNQYDFVADGEVLANSTSELSYLVDGIYKINATMSGQIDEAFIYIQDCAISNCKMKYIDAILKCKETNCEHDCLGQDKLYYNAIVVFELSQLYETILNENFIGITVPHNHILSSEQILKYTTILNLLSRISSYCIDCIEPCKNC